MIKFAIAGRMDYIEGMNHLRKKGYIPSLIIEDNLDNYTEIIKK